MFMVKEKEFSKFINRIREIPSIAFAYSIDFAYQKQSPPDSKILLLADFPNEKKRKNKIKTIRRKKLKKGLSYFIRNQNKSRKSG